MKKVFLIALCSLLVSVKSTGQKISIANEKMNIFYIGVDNPISIAAEGHSIKNLIIKTTNGEVIKDFSGNYSFRVKDVGPSEIILYEKANGKVKEIGRSTFRSLKIPKPVFKIGSGKHYVSSQEISSQEFVRADFENFDIDLNLLIEEFTVHIFRTDSCSSQTFVNKGNKISDEIRTAFKELKTNNILIFHKILVRMPVDGKIELEAVSVAIN